MTATPELVLYGTSKVVCSKRVLPMISRGFALIYGLGGERVFSLQNFTPRAVLMHPHGERTEVKDL